MKKNLFLGILLFFLVSCGRNIIEKPKKLLSESQMEALMYDLAMYESLKSVNYQFIDSLNTDIKTFIYQKFEIDSLILAENMVYYASVPKTYDKIIKKVNDQLTAKRDSLQKIIQEKHQNNLEKINKLEDLERLQ